MKESESLQEQEPSLEDLLTQYLVSFEAGKTSVIAKAAEKIRQWMQRSAMRQAIVRSRLQGQEEDEIRENERRNVMLPGLETDNKAISALKQEFFQED